MNRNTIIGLLLIFGIFIGWSLLNKPSKEELEEQKRKQDSIARVYQQRQVQDSISRALMQERERETEELINQSKEVTPVPLDQGASSEPDWEKHGVFTLASSGEDEFFVIENKLSKITLSSKGGRIYSVELKDYVTFDSLPLVLFDSDTSLFGLQFFASNRNIFTNDYYFIPYVNGQVYEGNNSFMVDEGEVVNLSMRLYCATAEGAINPGQYIEYIYAVQHDDYMIDFDINFVGMRDIISTRGNLIDLVWKVNTR
ncbi:MAG: YidC/Oxa1 family insertase periplasmic-domain containing protein, partial [Bacteroidota bacterium]|nr:YidC/Oxa1 family insertase periplasmic-domain containing protein [Bacteroidota bacterium]